MGHLHAVVVELPVAQVLEEVRLAVLVLEGVIDVVAHARPNAHVPRIVQLHLAGVVVDAPVQGAAGQIRSIVVAPHERGIDVGQGGRQSQAGQGFGVARSQLHRVEDIILTACKGEKLVICL